MAKFDVHTQSFAAQKIKSKRLINDMINGTKYSRVDQVNFVEDNLSKNLLSLPSIRYFVPNDIYTCIITFADLLQRRNLA